VIKIIHSKGNAPMQTDEHEDESADSAPSSEPRLAEDGTGDLHRYEEEEIATKPWPPLRW
jgi:hypothetical protein